MVEKQTSFCILAEYLHTLRLYVFLNALSFKLCYYSLLKILVFFAPVHLHRFCLGH